MFPNFFILYVSDTSRSAAFYQNLLQTPPIEASSTFAMFSMPSGVMLGLWQRDGVVPASDVLGGGGELAIAVQDRDTVDSQYAAWCREGRTTLSPPQALDFGYTFLAADPDGHRLRVFCPT